MRLHHIWWGFKSRIPHIQRKSEPFFKCWRLYGFKPYFRLCLIDYTNSRMTVGTLPHQWLRICGLTIYEKKPTQF